MRLPTALTPLRHPSFRLLWLANLVANTGMWMQNTGAGWLMTTLAPTPLMVSMVQVAALLPVFLLALPAGALADILDRRLYLIGTQAWMGLAGLLLAILGFAHMLGPWGLIALTFAIGAGTAMASPAWQATTPETVPRQDLAQAIVLNGIGFNITRAIGPAIGGLVVAAMGPEATFALNALAFLIAILAPARCCAPPCCGAACSSASPPPSGGCCRCWCAISSGWGRSGSASCWPAWASARSGRASCCRICATGWTGPRR
jgi:MFS family permease